MALKKLRAEMKRKPHESGLCARAPNTKVPSRTPKFVSSKLHLGQTYSDEIFSVVYGIFPLVYRITSDLPVYFGRVLASNVKPPISSDTLPNKSADLLA